MSLKKNAEMKHVAMNLLKVGAAILSAAALFACGDDSGNSSKADNEDNGREVATLVEMGRCTSEREGDTVYVAEKLTDYLCRNGSWIDLSESDDSDDETKSSSSMAPGSSSVIQSDSEKSSSSIDASSSSVIPSESEKSSSSFNKDKYTDENLVVKKRSILGVAQKGPFKFGSPVYLRELSEETLDPTGMVYEDEISSNKGDFVIPNVNLISPYAGVEVRGQYRNEVTGEYSKDSISLFVLTDLKTDSRTKVNINLLTHLEYKRAMYLVRKGYSVYAAKKQADQEIMTAFELPTTVKYSEDLSVFEDSEDDNVDYANASLMMLNLLFLGDRSDTEIKIAIDRFIADIEKDGSWEDDSTKAVMADFATEIDGDEIRANVKSWNILDVPRFEAQVEMFWNNVYGLGGCTSVRSGVIAQNKNKYSKNVNSYYLCKSSSWKKITNLEADTYGWDAGETGEVKKGAYTDAKYVYRGGAWTEVNPVEDALGSCTASKSGTVDKTGNVYYICKSNIWEKATTIEYDTYGWSAGAVGEVKKGNVTDARYVYRDGTWTEADAVESALGSCTASDVKTIKNNQGTYYVCEDTQWNSLATLEEADTYGWTAGTTGEVKKGNITDAKYVYRNSTWNAASTVESTLGSCTASNARTIVNEQGTYYVCESTQWKILTTLQANTYGWSSGTTGEVKKGNVTDAKYVYRNGKWNTASIVECALGSCTTKNDGTVSETGSVYYICKFSSWTRATALEYDTYGSTCSKDGSIVSGAVNANNKYVCDGGSFRTATADEINLELGCTSYNAGTVSETGSVYYICKSSSWTRATALEYDTYGYTCSKDGSIVSGAVNADNKYVCDDGSFRTATATEINLELGCTSYTQGKIITTLSDESVEERWVCSDQWIFNRFGIVKDSRDNKTYRTVTIGSQTWMAENLNYDYNEGTAKSYCYNNNPDSCAKYGRLYTWAAAMDSAAVFSTTGKGCGYDKTCSASGVVRGVCPEGWHLPSSSEFETLMKTVGSSVAATKLKSTYGWKSGNGTDDYGFSALPAGYRSNSGHFYDAGDYAYFWSASQSGSGSYSAYYMFLHYYYVYASMLNYSKYFGYSVRCLQDSN
ncbi:MULTISPECIES: fibrobacter succinogenes major paralogous domain-containing protein [unclassified Fibrobacter]|uniref:fibrobacter succinogenes major paralogous domain-containing protein n=1 Tax=unclassified Fibrobacter TaxID=2634177 RepID=UPI00091203F8|nr:MULTISPECIES: fibrobacter succinogenes major paralogous domain-containing protein [unclassified Fibrobacter]SHK42474.1 major paralogous domain-containing protein [Fibrobacter sp. UWH6]